LFNMCNITELDANNWVAISYANETADGKFIGRTYKVAGELAGSKFREYFGDGKADENKQAAYAMYYKTADTINE